MSTPRYNVTPRSDRRRRSPKYTPRQKKYDSPRRSRSKSSVTDRWTKSKSSTRYKREESSRRDERKSRRRSYSPEYRRYVSDSKEDSWVEDNSRREERIASYPSRVQKSKRSSTRDYPRERRDSSSRRRERKFSEFLPECRLHDIEACGGTRDFAGWFGKVPPNYIVDKDVQTDRGIFKKDNFQSSKDLDRYLEINSSTSPTDRRRWR